MIRLTGFDGRELVINALLVEKLEAVPDTVITLTTGNSYVVRESVDEVIAEPEAGSAATAAQWGRIIR